MKLHPQFTNTYSIVVTKATCPSQIYHTDLPLYDASCYGTELYHTIQNLNKGKFAPSGVSVMIVDSCYNEQIRQLQTGHLQFHGIKVEEQYGSI